MHEERSGKHGKVNILPASETFLEHSKDDFGTFLL
jgi:hypothetical protein